jgi:phosphatidylethanolamine/phosphatidyl-N-methylethanolamine N-methyltransferase
MKETLLFAREIVRRFRTTGAIAPSGGPLARAMARRVGTPGPDDVILELGPGTGVFTRELVRQFPNNRVIAVEVNEAFAANVEKTAPQAKVIRGCASELKSHLAALGVDRAHVFAVVSGLPLLSLPKVLGRAILDSITSVLVPGRRYVQFTYSARAWKQFEVPGFEPEAHARVWRNVPPAVVMSFVRKAGS